jgi:hypothetical protein
VLSFFLQSSELGLPQPRTRRRVCPHPLWFRGEGHIRWRERGWESRNSDEGTYTVVLCMHMYMYFVELKYSSTCCDFFFLLQPEQLAVAASVPVRQAVPAPPAAAAGQAQPPPLPPATEPAPHPPQSTHRRGLQSVLPARLAMDLLKSTTFIYCTYIYSPPSQTKSTTSRERESTRVPRRRGALNSHWILSQDGRPISKSSNQLILEKNGHGPRL